MLSEVVNDLTISLDIKAGSAGINIPRSSLIRGTSGAQVSLSEDWAFVLKDYWVKHQGGTNIDIKVSYEYADGIGNKGSYDYPEFLQIFNYIATLFKTYPNDSDSWELLTQTLVKALLANPIPTEFGTEYKLSEMVKSLTVCIDVKKGYAHKEIPYFKMFTHHSKLSLLN